jgi:hypothetical protein
MAPTAIQNEAEVQETAFMSAQSGWCGIGTSRHVWPSQSSAIGSSIKALSE